MKGFSISCGCGRASRSDNIDPKSSENSLASGDVFRIAAEPEPTVAGKRGFYEDQVAFFKELERFTMMRVNTGADPVHQSNLARFYRLDAEADLIRFEQSPGGGE